MVEASKFSFFVTVSLGFQQLCNSLVLLNEVQAIAKKVGAITDFIEISDNDRLSVKIVSTLRAALLKLDSIKGVSEQVKRGLTVLKSFAGTMKLKCHEIELSIGVDNERGVADSGTLSRDLAEVFVFAGEAAKARGGSIVILIDEIQNLPKEEFEALIIAVHRTDQTRLPIMIVGAGLPSLVKISAEAKTYAERLFDYSEVGALNDTEARLALVNPVKESSVDYSEDAVQAVLERTKGYTYFIQEWGYQSWNTATSSPITLADVQSAGKQAINRLDKNFFVLDLKYLRILKGNMWVPWLNSVQVHTNLVVLRENLENRQLQLHRLEMR